MENSKKTNLSDSLLSWQLGIILLFDFRNGLQARLVPGLLVAGTPDGASVAVSSSTDPERNHVSMRCSNQGIEASLPDENVLSQLDHAQHDEHENEELECEHMPLGPIPRIQNLIHEGHLLILLVVVVLSL